MNKNNNDNGRTHEPSLRELTAELDGVEKLLTEKINNVRAVMDERDRLNDTRFKAGETAVSAALAAQEKLTGASFAASKEAVLKAEDAQKDYNQRSNEFRGQLDDQAKTLMPRNEVSQMFKAYEEKLETIKSTESKDMDLVRSEIASLRESRSGQEHGAAVLHDSRAQSNWSTGIVVTLIVSVIGWAITVGLVAFKLAIKQ